MKADNNNKSPIKSVLVIVVGFLIIHYLTKWDWALLVAISVGVLGVLSDYLSMQIDYLWIKLAWLLSLIIPNILLTLIFYIILYPVSLLSKLFGNRDALNLKNKRDSFFRNSNKDFEKSSFEKPW